MDKKPLNRKWLSVGISTVSVILLILTSLSNVVGYQSVKSTTANDSPLFNVRTQRATNQQQNILTSQYLGKGIYELTFPLRDDKTEQLKRVIDRLQRMDDKVFAWFTTLCIQRAKLYDSLSDMNLYAIIRTLHVLRTHPDIIDSFLYKNIQNSYSYSISPWSPGCFIEGLYILLSVLLVIIIWLLIAIFDPNFTVECVSPT